MDSSNTTNMTTLQQAPPRDRTSRAESEFSAPEYNITYGQDHTLQWDPPVGSKELALALSYHFPLQADLASKMQAATRRFLRQERDSKKSKSNSNSPAAGDDQAASRDSSNPAVEEGKDSKAGTPGLQILTWDSGMKQYSHKTKRRRYDKGERVKVAANRGFACDVHRRQKMKCDPERCSRNKQHFSSLEAIPQSEVNTKPEDTQMTTEGRDPSIHSPEPSIQTENTDTTPPQSDGLSLYSITTSDTSQTSPRWSMSSVMNSTNLSFSENPYANNTFKINTPSLHPSLHPSLPGSSRAGHDSIGSVLSAYDLEFLANLPDYDVYHPNNDDPNAMWWTQDIPAPQENFLQDGFLPLSFPTNQDQYQNHNQQDQPHEHIDPRIEENSCSPPRRDSNTNVCCSSLEPQDIEMSASQPLKPSLETPPDPDLDPDLSSDSQTQPPTIPLTTVQKTTLLKWWGRDRLAEPQPPSPSRPTSSQSLNSHPRSSKMQTTSSTTSATKDIPSAPSSPTQSQKEKAIPSSSSISESHTTSTSTSGSGNMRGRRNTLASKVKAVHVQPPFLRRGLWRSSSAGRDGK